MCNWGELYVVPSLVYLSTGHPQVRSISRQIRTAFYSIRRGSMGVHFTECQASFTFRQGARRTDLCSRMSDRLFVSRIRWRGGLQPARLWAKSRLLVARVPIGPIYNKAIPM